MEPILYKHWLACKLSIGYLINLVDIVEIVKNMEVDGFMREIVIQFQK